MKTRVVLIDDQADDVVQRHLRELDRNRFELSSYVTLEGIRWEEVELADILLVDYYLSPQPGEGPLGTDFLRDLKERAPGFSGEILMLSVAAEDMDDRAWNECLRLGVGDFVSKGTPPTIIARKLDHLAEACSNRKLVDRLREKIELDEREAAVGWAWLPRLGALFPDERVRQDLLRALLLQGPYFSRGANSALLRVLDRVLGAVSNRVGRRPVPYPFQSAPTPPPPTQRNGVPPTDGEEVTREVPGGIPLRLLNVVLDNDYDALRRTLGDLFTGPAHQVYLHAVLLHVAEACWSLTEHPPAVGVGEQP